MRSCRWITAVLLGACACSETWSTAGARSVRESAAIPPTSEDHGARPRARAPSIELWDVAVDGAPAEGPRDAPVTIVEFIDYECTFCRSVEPTLRELATRFPGQLRHVVRQRPLAFHEGARGAATLALEAREQRGDATFFAVSRRLLASDDLSREGLLAIARAEGLDLAQVTAALDGDAFRATLADDDEAIEAAGGGGTPTFFVNGRRIVGAKSLATFESVVKERLVDAEARRERGQSAREAYEAIRAEANMPPPPPWRPPPAFSAANPTRGPTNARVTIQIFAEFECYYCRRAAPTLAELDRRFPGELRWVWRNVPLAMHEHARPAAIAGLEAKAQLGDAGFWRWYERLFAGPAEDGALERPRLLGHARALGLDLRRFERALDDERHAPTLDEDARAAEAAGVHATPTFLVGGWVVDGARSLSAFVRAVRLAQAQPEGPRAGASSPR